MSVLYVNADWSAIVPAGSAEAAFGCDPATARRLGLLPPDADVPTQEVPVAMSSANVKEAPPSDDKMAAKPSDKALRKPATK